MTAGDATVTVRDRLEARISSALEAAGAPGGSPAAVGQAQRPEFGDYQANGVMGAAKRLGVPPRELAQRLLDILDLQDLAERVEIAGPGFINIHLSAACIQEELARLNSETLQPRTPGPDAPTVVVDLSAPNLAKEMHVGHLRSTIIGDAAARTLEHLGYRVIRQNHVGDWGTQFGMLLTYLDELEQTAEAALEHELADLENFYRQAKARFDADPDFADRARETVVRLQSGDAECRRRWQQFIDISLSHCEEIYQRLGVRLGRADVFAESGYNDMLGEVVQRLEERDLLTEDDGALCVFMDEFKGKDDRPLPLIVRKSDGGYLYSTTDLAAAWYRSATLHADRVLYFVDKRQALHFRQVFTAARAAGMVDDSTSLEHMPFGTMLGEDGRPFKTRAGGVVKLSDLLAEAEQRALALVSEKNPDLDEAIRRDVAHVVGMGAVKYADLSKHRSSDYVFSWESMLSFDGNTAPYLQYAYSRIRSLFGRAGVEPGSVTATPMLDEPAERRLALTLIRLPETLRTVAREGMPHLLCAQLYDTAVAFMNFYEQCPVLSAAADVRDARLAMAQLTARSLATGLDLLGVGTVERM